MSDILLHKADRTAVDLIFRAHMVRRAVEFEEERHTLQPHLVRNPYSFSVEDLERDLITYIARVRAEVIREMENKGI